MRAFVCSRITDDLSGTGILDIATPAPGPGQALVRVAAAGVNFPDVLMCQGKYQFKPEPPFTPGMEMAGEVVALGEGVSGIAVGDAVVGGAGLGGFAELCVAPAAALRKVPKGVDLQVAASFQAAYLTAYVALVRRGRIEPGEALLVHGAAGGVGLACVDLGLALGARVIATASTPEKRAVLEARGVVAALAPAGFRDAVKDLTGGRGADVVYDPVGGDVFDESVRCIAFDGRLLVIGFTSGRIPTVSVNMPLIKGFSVVGVRAGEYGRQFPQRGRENLDAVWTMLAEGRLKPHVHAAVPLADTRAALDMLQTRAVIGKVVVTP
ncbi:MAG: NADPH:quinone oxidoreductase family protein [Alphaproteobacteria bacterium]|nr:NADPH:quinone oxidoreductase family protein [Alphaproteobacteria bacterium]